MKSRKDRFDGEKELGKRLRECRLEAGLTQPMLAVAMGSQYKGNHAVGQRGTLPIFPSDVKARRGIVPRYFIHRCSFPGRTRVASANDGRFMMSAKSTRSAGDTIGDS